MVVRACGGPTTRWPTFGLSALLTVLACTIFLRPSFAEGVCTDASGHEIQPVAHLVSAVGEVSVAGRAPAGAAPYRPICAGDAVVVGPRSRAAVNLIGADTPLRLRENTVSRF